MSPCLFKVLKFFSGILGLVGITGFHGFNPLIYSFLVTNSFNFGLKTLKGHCLDFGCVVLLYNVLITMVIRRSKKGICNCAAINYIECSLGWFLFHFFNIKEFLQVIAQNMVDGFVLRLEAAPIRYGNMKDLFRRLWSLGYLIFL